MELSKAPRLEAILRPRVPLAGLSPQGGCSMCPCSTGLKKDKRGDTGLPYVTKEPYLNGISTLASLSDNMHSHSILSS